MREDKWVCDLIYSQHHLVLLSLLWSPSITKCFRVSLCNLLCLRSFSICIPSPLLQACLTSPPIPWWAQWLEKSMRHSLPLASRDGQSFFFFLTSLFSYSTEVSSVTLHFTLYFSFVDPFVQLLSLPQTYLLSFYKSRNMGLDSYLCHASFSEVGNLFAHNCSFLIFLSTRSHVPHNLRFFL